MSASQANRKSKVLLVGSSPPPFHGQAICFEAATKSIEGDTKIIETSLRSKTKIHSIFKLLFYTRQVIAARIEYKPTHIYFLASRTLIGGLRDLILILSFYHHKDCKITNHIHGANFNEFIKSLPWGIKSLFMYAYKRVDVHITLTDAMQTQLNELFPFATTKTIKNFCYNPPKVIDSKKIPYSFIYLSSIAHTKGIFDAIKIVDYIHEKIPQATLTIAGPYLGDKILNSRQVQSRFEKAIHNKSHIDYVGTVYGKQKFERLNASSFFILPTFYESEALPLAIIEAMHCGCVILTTNHNYLPDIVLNNVNGLIFEPNSSRNASKEILSILSDPKKTFTIQQTNRAHSRKHYSQEKYQSEIRKLFT